MDLLDMGSQYPSSKDLIFVVPRAFSFKYVDFATHGDRCFSPFRPKPLALFGLPREVFRRRTFLSAG